MPRAGLTTESVIEAAGAIADREGLAAVSLARLAADLGVRSPSLYKHIEGLDAVHRALAVRGLREATARLQRATVGKARDDALLALAHAYWQFARDRPGLYAAALPSPTLNDKEIAMAGEALMGTLIAVLGGYGLKGDDMRHAVRGLRAIIHGFVSLDSAGGFRLKGELAASFDRLITAFASDLEARAA